MPKRGGKLAVVLLVERLEPRCLLNAALPIAHPFSEALRFIGSGDISSLAANASTAPAILPGVAELSPAQLRAAYGVDNIQFDGTVGDGTGQTIAIVDAYDSPNLSYDLAWFDQVMGLTDPPSFTRLDQNGGTDYPATDMSDPSPNTWELEEALDVEYAHAIAPNANIILYEASSASTDDLLTAVDTARNNPAVSVVSMSWGENEFFGENSQDSFFTTPASRIANGQGGVTFFAASGDSGSPGAYPSYSPNVVSIGGTTLLVNLDNSYFGEIGWSGSGGGNSLLEPEPAYQTGVQQTGRRSTPDVAMDADRNTGVPVFDSYDGGWWQVGGTSVAAPVWAALGAIADQGRALNGLPSLDGPSQTLPLLYNLPNSAFHDVTTGSNFGFLAGLGYDRVTGLGSPVADVLVEQLASLNWPMVASVSPTGSTIAGSQTVTITGMDLTNTTSVMFGNLPATSFTVDSDSSITAVVPPEPAGTVDVMVTTADGISSTLWSGDQYLIVAQPVVTLDPVDQVANVGSTATFTAGAGGAGTINVQWQSSLDGGQTFYDIDFATSLSYTTPPIASTDDGTEFRAVFTNAGGSIATAAATLTAVSPVSVMSVVVNGNNPALIGTQRSLVDSIVYTFSEAVALAPGAFSLAIDVEQTGTVPTLNYTSSDGGLTWIVTFSGAGAVGNSIANGVYDITLDPSAVTSQAHPTAAIIPGDDGTFTETFYRLYGDCNGDQVVNASDNLQFKNAITTYDAIFDYNNDGVVNASDNLQFKRSISFSFNAPFIATI
jgi:hypothetical protein